jgi:hypothetical protein
MRSPEIYGDFWFNSAPLALHSLQGNVVLLVFWDYTSENSLRSLEYVKEWDRRYRTLGFTAIGIHSPEFSFARDARSIEEAVKGSQIDFPVTTDNTRIMRDSFRISEVPTVVLVDRDGNIYYSHAGEGGFDRTERAIQTLLHEAGYRGDLPLLLDYMLDTRLEEQFYLKATPEIRTSYLYGTLGNVEGYNPELPAEYDDPSIYVEGKFYAEGRWIAKADSFVYDGEPEQGFLIVRYSGKKVNAVISSESAGAHFEITRDGLPVENRIFGRDVITAADGVTTVNAGKPQLVNIILDSIFGDHVLKLIPSERGMAVYALIFSIDTSPIGRLPLLSN